MINLIHGDCLEKMKDIPDGSVDLVLCDPPYGTVKGLTMNGWEKKDVEWDIALKPNDFFPILNKKARANGTIILFSQEPYTSRLITEQNNNLPFCYRMIWEKNTFGNPLFAKTAPVSYFEDVLVFCKKYDTELKNPLREYSKKIFDCIGLNLKEINKNLKHQKAEHFFRFGTSQFGLCSRAVYDEIVETFSLSNLDFFKGYDELSEINNEFKKVFKKVFNLQESKKHKSNILKYKKETNRYHPTQKPVALLEDLIRTYSNAGDIVLDFTMGSGSTGIACLNTGRRFIGIEKEDHYFKVAKERIENHQPPSAV